MNDLNSLSIGFTKVIVTRHIEFYSNCENWGCPGGFLEKYGGLLLLMYSLLRKTTYSTLTFFFGLIEGLIGLKDKVVDINIFTAGCDTHAYGDRSL